jgi:hypothetical protein
MLIWLNNNLAKVLFGVLSGAMNMGLTTPHLEAFAVARGSAATIFAVLDRVPEIDSLSKTGQKPAGLQGDIQLEGVHFQYPARPEIKVGVVFMSHKSQETPMSHFWQYSVINFLTAFPV